MRVERSLHPRWLSNSYLVIHQGDALVIDAGADPDPLLTTVDREQLTVRAVILTHHHPDHCLEAARWTERTGAEVWIHEAERDRVDAAQRSATAETTWPVGDLVARALHIPGHTAGQLAVYLPGQALFTGDTLFRGSVGGTRGSGHTTFDDLRRSLLDVLFDLPPETPVYPGHTEPTTLAHEWETNPFIRTLRGIDPPEDVPCLALGQPATLRVLATDYDGGTKAWVRFADGREDTVPGSRVERLP